jgi:hypothetical protein
MNVSATGDPTWVFAVIALLLFVVAGWVWHRGWVQEHLRRPVLVKPIRFEEGFSFTSSFSVAYASYYWVDVVCLRTNVSYPSQFREVVEILSSELPVKFTITCDGITVAEGDSHSRGGGLGVAIRAIVSRAELWREMTAFSGEPDKRYDLSFRTVGTIPALDAAKPILRIGVLGYGKPNNLGDMLFCDTTPALFIGAVGLLFAISPCRILAGRLFRHEPNGT